MYLEETFYCYCVRSRCLSSERAQASGALTDQLGVRDHINLLVSEFQPHISSFRPTPWLTWPFLIESFWLIQVGNGISNSESKIRSSTTFPPQFRACRTYFWLYASSEYHQDPTPGNFSPSLEYYCHELLRTPWSFWFLPYKLWVSCYENGRQCQ